MAQPKKHDAAQTVPMPPADLPTVTCWCGAKYLDASAGRDSHMTVFGHTPNPTALENDE